MGVKPMEVTMRRSVATVGAAVAVFLVGSATGWAGDGALDGMKTWPAAGTILEQRKDVQEVALPSPPSGPATPVPYCTPAQPICP
jgi:hypothetical protein